jgi:hypothetical protein
MPLIFFQPPIQVARPTALRGVYASERTGGVKRTKPAKFLFIRTAGADRGRPSQHGSGSAAPTWAVMVWASRDEQEV